MIEMHHRFVLATLAAACGMEPTSAAQPLQACDPHESSTAAGSFWSSDVMTDETVLMIRDAAREPRGSLLWPASEILSVRDSSLGREFQRDIDYTYDPATHSLTLTAGSSATYLTLDTLYTDGQPRHEESHFFHSQHLSITYRHARGLWNGPVQENALPRIAARLRAQISTKLAVLGDSISAGYNASGFTVPEAESGPVAPYMPPWPQLVRCGLQAAFGAEVELINPSQPGKTSAWGADVVHELVSVRAPDLVIIAFGMNDRTMRVNEDDFVAHLSSIMDSVRAKVPHAEFILVAPMLANPEWELAGDPQQYRAALAHLATQPGVALVDMTSTHEELLKSKRYVDMTGNGLNHPNDFLSRWYAQLILAAAGAIE